MSGPEREDPFEAYLRHRSVLPGGMHGSQRLEPPEDLDQIVLNRAREAIQAPRQTRLYRAPRWALPVALAATILLSFSILLNVSVMTGKAERAAVGSPAPSSPQTPAGRTPPAIDTSARATEVPSPEVSMTAPASPGARLKKYTSPAPALESAPASSMNTPTAEVRDAAEPAHAAQAHSEEAKASDAGASSAQTRDPQAWLKQIDALRAQGKTAEADEQLRLFREAFPRYPVKPSATLSSDPPK